MSELCARMCISVSYLYRLLASGLFPPLVRVGRRSCRLPEHVLDSWLWQCIEMRSTMHTLRDPVVLPEWPPLVVVPSMVRAIRMVRFPAVLRRVGLKRSPLYRQIAERRFPAPCPSVLVFVAGPSTSSTTGCGGVWECCLNFASRTATGIYAVPRTRMTMTVPVLRSC